MCGIAGIVRFDGGALAQVDRVRAMRRALRHRGPDGEGEFVSRDAVLGHTRLAMLDRAGGAQPMTTPDGRFTIVFNGEIYDHERVRRELVYPFSTDSDAETVLAAFAVWGYECVDLLNGMFAFFVWDAAAKRGVAMRDRLGVKPLAYAWDGQEFVFASEANVVARALPGPVRADHDAVLEYLVAPCFSGVERPMFAGVSYLQPGSWIRVTADGAQVRRYYRFAVAKDGDGPADELLRGAFERAVRRTCASDEPLAVFLSGGLDSTAVAAVAAKCLPRLRAYSIVFAGMREFDYRRSAIVVSDDMEYVGAAVEATGVDWRAVEVPREELAADLERVATTNDALPAWEQEVAQDRLARAAAADGYKGVLVGDAADETHYGYHFLLDPEATAGPERIIRRFGGVAVRREILEDPVEAFAERYRAWVRPEADAEERIAGTTRLIVERWLPRLLHNGDIHCMRSGVEARVPFADNELLALAASVPPRAGLAGGEKARLRAALRGVVPEAIRTRRKSALPKDQGAGPVYQREAARLLAEPPALVRELVDLAAVRTSLDERRELGEWERAGLFRVIGLCHFSRHHGIP
jgi:asparagine synthase (glutamine-hydrolysing)